MIVSFYIFGLTTGIPPTGYGTQKISNLCSCNYLYFGLALSYFSQFLGIPSCPEGANK